MQVGAESLCVGDGVIIDGSKLGLTGGLFTGVVKMVHPDKWIQVFLPRKVEREALAVALSRPAYSTINISPHQGYNQFIITVPNCERWLTEDMP